MPAIQLSVFSEIDRLKQVVVHDPGPEVDLMVPQMMEELLFDDLLFGDLARKEHRQFRQVLARVAEEVLDVQDLFLEALERRGLAPLGGSAGQDLQPPPGHDSPGGGPEHHHGDPLG